MYLLFEDAGKFLAGRILSETDASSQVEVASGKRHKVKATHALLRFEQPEPAQLLTQGTTTAEEIDLDLAWECAGEEEFGFADLAADYFGAKPSTVQLAAALFRLFEAPHYFRRAGKGRFKKASQEVLQQALAGIAKRQAIQAEIDKWTEALCAHQCPEPIKAQLYKILFKPDKNAPEYKAVVAASKQTQMGALNLLAAAGAISSPLRVPLAAFFVRPISKGYCISCVECPRH